MIILFNKERSKASSHFSLSHTPPPTLLLCLHYCCYYSTSFATSQHHHRPPSHPSSSSFLPYSHQPPALLPATYCCPTPVLPGCVVAASTFCRLLLPPLATSWPPIANTTSQHHQAAPHPSFSSMKGIKILTPS